MKHFSSEILPLFKDETKPCCYVTELWANTWGTTKTGTEEDQSSVRFSSVQFIRIPISSSRAAAGGPEEDEESLEKMRRTKRTHDQFLLRKNRTHRSWKSKKTNWEEYQKEMALNWYLKFLPALEEPLSELFLQILPHVGSFHFSMHLLYTHLDSLVLLLILIRDQFPIRWQQLSFKLG